MVNLEWYRTFKTVYETGSLTAASKVLYISQPNVSQHISSLEAYIGKPLFERKYKIIPTDYAKIIYAQIAEPIDRLEAAEMSFKKTCLQKSKPTLNIGSLKEYFHLLATHHMEDFPAMIIATFDEYSKLLQKLRSQELHAVITTEKTEGPNLIFDLILEEHLCIVASPEYPTEEWDFYVKEANIPKMENWLLNQNWLSNNSEMTMVKKFWKPNFKKDPLIIPQVVMPDVQTMLQSVALGSAIAVSTDHLVSELLAKQEIKLLWKGNIPVYNNVYLAYDKSKLTDDYLSTIKNLFRPVSR